MKNAGPSLAKPKPVDSNAAPSGATATPPVSPAERRAAQRERITNRRVQQKRIPAAETAPESEGN